MSRSIRPGTAKLYDVKWKAFCVWCDECRIVASEVSTLVDFLTSLLGLAPSTVEGYRSAIAETLRVLRDIDITSDPCIRGILRNRRLNAPLVRNKIPPWDLGVVLKYLSGAPFETRKGASFSDITLTALFLLALASGKRRGEIHALTREGLSWNYDKTIVYCAFDPTFISKT